MARIRLSRSIGADRAAVFAALSTQDHLANWFAPHVITTPVAGTHAAFAFEEELYFKVMLLEVHPHEKLVWKFIDGNVDWDGSKITFRLEKKEEKKTRLIFSHSGLTESEKLGKWKKSWSKFMDQLKKYTERDLTDV